ncbi:MAG: MarR family transcriptional regulator [Paludibacter sp.]|nr:MarR family transcriptional regulator [Paludibacter sp.]
MTKSKGENVNSIVENLLSIHPMLSKNISRAIRSKTNLNPGSLFVIGMLKKHKLLSMTEIGCKLSMPKPHVTAHIDKLIAAKLVERLNDPNDRRIINIQLTAKGLQDFEAIKKDITEELRIQLNKLDENRLQNLQESSQIVRDVLTEIVIDNVDQGCAKK